MGKFLAIFAAALGAVYSDFSSADFISLIFVICFLQLLLWLHAMGLFDNDGFCGGSEDSGDFMGCDGGGFGDTLLIHKSIDMRGAG